MDHTKRVLLVTDVQRDFCAGGALAVPDGDAVVGPINRLARNYDLVVLTQDWHPAEHRSFASQHPGRAPFDEADFPYGLQTLWPDHCVQGTPGAEFHPDLSIPHAALIIRKGFRASVDSYSAFAEADGTVTGLGAYLRDRGVQAVDCVGLATDYCVAWSAEDAARQGFRVRVFQDACRAIDLNDSLAAAWARLSARGVTLAKMS
ncbi:MAG: bifunctional nicotinamidase/pyrazinamidase [Elstera sp.]